MHSTFSPLFFVKESPRRRFCFVLFDFLFFMFFFFHFLAYFFKYFLVHKFLCASKKYSLNAISISIPIPNANWALFVPVCDCVEHFSATCISMCPFGCTYNSNACHTTNANRVVARFSAKAKKAPGFSMVSLWFLSSLCVCVCVCVVVFLRETIKKLNRKLASHFVLKGKFNIKALHCTHGRQGATHTHSWGQV